MTVFNPVTHPLMFLTNTTGITDFRTFQSKTQTIWAIDAVMSALNSAGLFDIAIQDAAPTGGAGQKQVWVDPAANPATAAASVKLYDDADGNWKPATAALFSQLIGRIGDFTNVATNGATFAHFEAGAAAAGSLGLVSISTLTPLFNSRSSAGSIAIGLNAGGTGLHEVFLGRNAGTGNTRPNVVGVGSEAMANNTGSDATAVGFSALKNNTGAGAVGIGFEAGLYAAGTYTINIGYASGQNVDGSGQINIGYASGQNAVGTDGINIGTNAGQHVEASRSINIGYASGQNAVGTDEINIGTNAGQHAKSSKSINIGTDAGIAATGRSAVSIGEFAGRFAASEYTVHVGWACGEHSSAKYSTFAGHLASRYMHGSNCVALGTHAGTYSNADKNTFVGAHSGPNVFTRGADYTSTINVAEQTFDIGAHSFLVGSSVTLIVSGTTAPTGMLLNRLYTFKAVSSSKLKPTVAFTSVGDNVTLTKNAAPEIDYTNVTAVGYNAEATRSNQVSLGDSLVTEVKTAGTYKSGTYGVASLPPAATAGVGSTAYVTDGTGAGQASCPVYCDGVNWRKTSNDEIQA